LTTVESILSFAPLLSLDPAAKVFVSSGYSDDPVLMNFQTYSFSGALPKPITLETLQNVVVPLLRDSTGEP
jgi:hypothetical protein